MHDEKNLCFKRMDKLHARRKKHVVEMLSKKALRPNGATKDSLTLGNKRPSEGPETSRRDDSLTLGNKR